MTTGLDAMLDELRATRGHRIRDYDWRISLRLSVLVISGLSLLIWSIIAIGAVEVARMAPSF